MEDQKLSEAGEKITASTIDELNQLDVCEQNLAVKIICSRLLEIRKETLDKMVMEKEEFAKSMDEFILGLQGIK